MPPTACPPPQHPSISRRTWLQAGSVGLLGLGMNHLAALRAAGAAESSLSPPAQSVIYIFLSGGLAQHDSFDMKPAAPDNIRGEFRPIATRTPGIEICEHLPMLAARSHLWALVRSLTHHSNDHSAGHHIMLTGRGELPPGFNPSAARPGDWPSIASLAAYATAPRHNLPPAVVLPERLIHNTGRVIPGQFAGILGQQYEPWFVDASPFHATSYGAYPQYQFDHQERGHADGRLFQAPNLSLPQGIDGPRFRNRLAMLDELQRQRQRLEQAAERNDFDRYRQGIISLLADPRVQTAFDVTRADEATQDRYGRNAFGWSLLMARRLVEAGVNLVQVNLGNNETWDTHGEAFPHLKDKLLPPTDRAVSALLDDLQAAGLLSSTLVVMAGEFGRTPKIKHLPQHYKLPGRDHWGAVQSVFFAGGGVRGGTVVGSSDKIGAFPAAQPQTPENMAATIYRALGIPPLAVFHDALDRPHAIYHGEPIAGLCG
ncbi:MAG TPA: DUF1501 domain-containing protein [Pirellulales bacterium]|nr:DUF1501 domain-containing protein [Pirellulales bacterium]